MINTTCINCVHYELSRSCKAFSKIPSEIWNGDNGHRKPLKSQNNRIVYRKLKLEAAK